MARGRCSFRDCHERSGYGPHGYCKMHTARVQSQLNRIKRNLTENLRKRILRDQYNSCAICAEPFGTHRPIPDHCHESGVLRGFLCYRCNNGLGMFHDSIRLLAAAIVYLQDSEDKVNTALGKQALEQAEQEELEKRIRDYQSVITKSDS